MNTDQNSLRFTTNLEQSEQLAAKLAAAIKSPVLIELVGDLGGGKTAFVKALGKALGVEQTITSPTFNIHRSYKYPDGVLEHFDLYRLADDAIVLSELNDCIADTSAVVAVEWAEHFHGLQDQDHLTIEFRYLDENSRAMIFSANGSESNKLLGALR